MAQKRAVVAIVNYNDKVLLGKKRSDSSKFLAGKWHIPGENVEGNETDAEALIRGIREEAGIEIKIGQYLGDSLTPTSHKKARWYECFASSDVVVPGSDLEDLKWVSKREVIEICKERIPFWPKKAIDYFSD
ncbi:NUDIX domain-containing protein [Candidatus Pacearchaeota archaeon]|nr:NUDIX domain-containing protein [Candidatus Pacearchaeota archaeon]